MGSGETVRIGSRGSPLALAQTGWVVARLHEHGLRAEVTPIGTRGDSRRDVPVAAIGGDGVFVRELEQALLEGRIDAAVHSLKDVPTAGTPGLRLAAIPARGSPFDALVGRTASRLEDLPPGSRVGTSSVRRLAQVAAARSDLRAVPVRGNVDTRLRRLDAGEYDALILAAAGLERLGLGERVTQILEPPLFWPAVAQGALAIQVRADDGGTAARVATVDDPPTHAAVLAERRMLAGLAGGCLAPIGGWARRTREGTLALGGCVLGGDVEAGAVERLVVELETSEAAPGAAESLGADVAERLLAAGAADLLAAIRVRLA